MTELLAPVSPRLSQKRLHGRVTNAVAHFLRDRLSVPYVYLSPRIQGMAPTDVLAVDRAGGGDLHGVEIKTVLAVQTRSQLRAMLRQVMLVPFHYKYIALPESLNPVAGLARFVEYPELFDETGIGRVGILSFDANLLDIPVDKGPSAVRLIVRPERFRVTGKGLIAIEKFLAKAKPDMEVRI